MAACRILLEGVDAGCADAGLSAASQGDVNAINAIREDAGAGPATGALRVLAQLEPGQAQSGWCQNEQSLGWCYVAGSWVPEAGCMHDICATLGFSAGTVMYELTWLACP